MFNKQAALLEQNEPSASRGGPERAGHCERLAATNSQWPYRTLISVPSELASRRGRNRLVLVLT